MAFDPFKPKKDPFWDQEVAIKFRPRKAIKLFAVLLILLLVFYLGRWSVSESSSVEKTPSPESSSNITAKIVGFITSLFTSNNEETSQEEIPKVNKTKTTASANQTTSSSRTSSNQTTTQNQSSTNQSTAGGTANNDTSSTVVSNEEVITSYKRVSFAIENVGKEWHTTWGKITYFTYTIKNEETGTIKPSYFLMKVEGYPDIDKKVPLSESSQTIKSKTSISSTAFVPQGFAYNEVTAGNLENLKITFVLFDSSDKTMASYEKEFNVKG